MPDRNPLGGHPGGDPSCVDGSIQLSSGPRPIDLAGFFAIAGAAGAGKATFDLMRCGDAFIGDMEAANHTFTRDFAMVASGKTEDILVIAVISGALQGVASTGPVSAGPNEVVLIDLSEVLMVETRDLIATVWLLPRSVAFAGQLGYAWWQGFVLPSTHKVSHLVVSMMHEATKLCRSLEDRADSSVIDPVVVMLSSVLRSEQAQASSGGRAAPNRSQTSIKRYIDEHLSDPDLAVEMLARKFGMSRASLYREFASFGGIAEYIRRQRLQRAIHELRAQGDRPLRLSALARKLGFKSADGFSRSFAAAFGMPPRQFKKDLEAHPFSFAAPPGGIPEE